VSWLTVQGIRNSRKWTDQKKKHNFINSEVRIEASKGKKKTELR